MFLFTNSFGNSALTLIGALTCLYYLVKYSWKLLFGIRIYILSKFWKVDLTYFGEWAVVTGATNGIGKAYAHELARRGLNIVLISRSLEKLKTTAEEIEQKHGKKTKIIQADFTAGTDIYGPIQEVLNGMNIGVLVNNVGKTYNILPCYFLDVPDVKKAVTDIVFCNALSVSMMTAVVLPQMVDRKKGVIINMSSEAGTFPHPMLAMYSATKVFIDFFSRALNVEYKSQGIITQCVMPLLVSTNLTNNVDTGLLVKRADDYVREALNTVGITEQTRGCISHALQHWLIERLFPDCYRLSQFGLNSMKKLTEARKKWLEEKKKSKIN
ncbi:very-long-chain 3-oxoacyl-CoA reductase-B-like isoform X2 [Hypanus sabinus]|uniref:very-long-chain 3-oxoacyl-CoA reductase-B-like isoform X2 n=1 Tax=Hypanus sabinus TaxID=79690 RepID=UPI0028C3F54D|nr:very-long-chain 3-oxoacyl-CoA reductase-B-like isoform X2 [Hypanus sabinus]